MTKTLKITRKGYEEYLNEEGSTLPFICNGKYGSWLRRNDPIAFSVGFNEWKNQNAADSLRGIWKDLPDAAQKELTKKLYCICGRADCPDCGGEE